MVCGRCLAQEHEWNELEERGPGWWVCPKCGAELLLSDVEEADDDFASARELFEDELRVKNRLRRPGSSHSAKVRRKRPRPKPEPWYRRGFECFLDFTTGRAQTASLLGTRTRTGRTSLAF